MNLTLFKDIETITVSQNRAGYFEGMEAKNGSTFIRENPMER